MHTAGFTIHEVEDSVMCVSVTSTCCSVPEVITIIIYIHTYQITAEQYRVRYRFHGKRLVGTHGPHHTNTPHSPHMTQAKLTQRVGQGARPHYSSHLSESDVMLRWRLLLQYY